MIDGNGVLLKIETKVVFYSVEMEVIFLVTNSRLITNLPMKDFLLINDTIAKPLAKRRF